MDWEFDFTEYRTEEERERDEEETRRAFFQATDEAVARRTYNSRMRVEVRRGGASDMTTEPF